MRRPSVLLVSSSRGFIHHARLALGPGFDVSTVAPGIDLAAVDVRAGVVIVHVGRLAPVERDDVFRRLREQSANLAVAADVPTLVEMLDLSRHGIRAYFNSHMTDVHFRQMVSMVGDGMTWFSPPLMADALALARRALDGSVQVREEALEPLTHREREIAADVAAGLSNREIAVERHIAERTVKAHLTRIFRKLGARNRHALAVKLRGG